MRIDPQDVAGEMARYDELFYAGFGPNDQPTIKVRTYGLAPVLLVAPYGMGYYAKRHDLATHRRRDMFSAAYAELLAIECGGRLMTPLGTQQSCADYEESHPLKDRLRDVCTSAGIWLCVIIQGWHMGGTSTCAFGADLTGAKDSPLMGDFFWLLQKLGEEGKPELDIEWAYNMDSEANHRVVAFVNGELKVPALSLNFPDFQFQADDAKLQRVFTVITEAVGQFTQGAP